MRVPVEKRWCGVSDVKTQLAYFGYNGFASAYGTLYEGNAMQYGMWERAFGAVYKMLLRLEEGGHVQLAYVDNTMVERRVVAYRFTSDQAYDCHHSALMSVGIVMSFGKWDSFGDQHQFSEYLSEVNGTLAIGVLQEREDEEVKVTVEMAQAMLRIANAEGIMEIAIGM